MDQGVPGKRELALRPDAPFPRTGPDFLGVVEHGRSRTVRFPGLPRRVSKRDAWASETKVSDWDRISRLTSTPDMSTENRPPEAPKTPETTSTPNLPTNPKGGKPKKAKEAEEKVPITFSVSSDFARKLKIVISAMDESSGEYVESRLSSIVKRDLKKILEEMA